MPTLTLNGPCTLRWSDPKEILSDTVLLLDTSIRKLGVTSPVVSIGLIEEEEDGTNSFTATLVDNATISDAVNFTTFTDVTSSWGVDTKQAHLVLVVHNSADLEIDRLGFEDVTQLTQATNQAVLSESHATAADDFRAQAEFERNVAALVNTGSAYINPLFSDWDSTYPDGVSGVLVTDGSSITKETDDAKYVNAILCDTGSALTADMPQWSLSSASSEIGLPSSDDCFGIQVNAELELLSGAMAGSAIKFEWIPGGTGGTAAEVILMLSDAVVTTLQNTIQLLEYAALRPDTFVAGSAEGTVSITVYGTSNFGGATRTENQILWHRFGLSTLSISASSTISQLAYASINNLAVSSLVFRTKAGTSGAEIELVSAYDPVNGEVSSAKVSADEILLAGSVKVPHLTISEYLDIDTLNAGVRLGKTSITDNSPGLYMGRIDDGSGGTGFGFTLSRTESGIREQSIRVSNEDVLTIQNADHVIAAGNPVEIEKDTTGVYDLTSGTLTVELDIVGGGGGGARLTGTAGTDGGDTVVILKDGVTTIQTWTATGGSGAVVGYTTYANHFSPKNARSPNGRGGKGEMVFIENTHDEAESGSGSATYARAGDNGEHITILSIDVSGLTDPKLDIAIGGGGTGAGSSGTGDTGSYGGADGSDGIVTYTEISDVAIPAGVIALTPSVTGQVSFSLDTDVALPETGPGMWVFLGLPDSVSFDLGDGTTFDMKTLYSNEGGNVTFISPGNATWSSDENHAWDIDYLFYPMG